MWACCKTPGTRAPSHTTLQQHVPLRLDTPTHPSRATFSQGQTPLDPHARDRRTPLLGQAKLLPRIWDFFHGGSQNREGYGPEAPRSSAQGSPLAAPKWVLPGGGPRAAPHPVQPWALTVIRLLLREQLWGGETANERHKVLAGGSEEGGGITIPSRGFWRGAPHHRYFTPLIFSD